MADIRKGENIDYGLMIISSIIISIASISIVLLDILGRIDLTIYYNRAILTVTSLILGALGIICITNLRTRYMLANHIRSIDDFFIMDFIGTNHQERIAKDLDSSQEVILIGRDLTTTLKDLYSVLANNLKNGKSIKVILVNPNSAACKMAAMCNIDGTDEKVKHNEIAASMNNRCKGLYDISKNNESGEFELHLTECLPAFGAILIDPETSGTIYMWHYTYKSEKNRNRPKMILNRSEGYWYDLFKDEILKMWQTTNPYDFEMGNE